jgi:uncharacterized repeat protein (TIGR01451 family)
VNVTGGDLLMVGNTFENNRVTDFSGGGVYMAGGHITAIGNIIRNNPSGGVAVVYGTAELNRNTFRGNSHYGVRGSGTASMDSNTFDENSAVAVDVGGTLVLNGNTFIRNSGEWTGGGLVADGATGSLTGNTFRENSAFRGGGAYLRNSTLVLSDNSFLANSAADIAGALYLEGSNVVGLNNLIADHATPLEAVYLADSTLTARHWTLANNGEYALTTDGSSTVALTNTIVAAHGLAGFWGSGISADHSLFFDTGTPCGGGGSCTNNLSGDPKFQNPAGGDHHIKPGSAAIDSGIDAGVSSDIDGDPRPLGAGFDIGADEAVGGPFLTVAKIATPDSARPGALLTYTLYVTNTGTVSLTTSVTDSLPAQVTPT